MVWKSVLIQLIEWVIVECLHVQWVGNLAADSGLEGKIFRLLGGEFCDSHRFRDAESRVVPLAFSTRPFNSASVLVMLVKE